MLVAGVSGCGITTIYGDNSALMYRAPGDLSATTITSRFTIERDNWDGRKQYTITAYADGEQIIHGQLGPTGSGDVTGSWRGKPAVAVCSRTQLTQRLIEMSCRLILNGELAGTIK